MRRQVAAAGDFWDLRSAELTICRAASYWMKRSLDVAVRCALERGERAGKYLQEAARLAGEGGGFAVVGLHVGVEGAGEIDELVDGERGFVGENEWVDLEGESRKEQGT